MDFTKHKLPIEATSQLRMCPIETVKPYALMIAPVYVYMKRNSKYIAVKAPLDFFTEEELEHLKSFEMFFMPAFVDRVLPYRQVARRLKRILNWKPDEGNAEIGLPPFEVADATLRVLAPLWGPKQNIESFFVSIFANEFCGFFPSAELVEAREKSFEELERALVVSAWMVLLSLHTGVTDPRYLDSLRLNVFRNILNTASSDTVPRLMPHSDAGELYRVLEEHLTGEKIRRGLGVEFFENRSERVARKIVARLGRVRESLMSGDQFEATIYGSEGFIDV